MTPRYPAVALGLLGMVDGLYAYALVVLGPDIARTLGVGVGTLGAITVVVLLATSLAVLPVGALVRGGRHRAATSIAGGLTWAAACAGAAVATSAWALAATAAVAGATGAVVRAVHPALIADVYEAAARVRALATHQGLDALGVVVAPALVAALGLAGLTWRGVLLAAAGLGTAVAVLAVRLRDPGIRPIHGAPRALPRDRAGGAAVAEQVRALLLVPSLRRIAAGGVVAGAFLVPLLTHLLFFLEGQWGLDAVERAAFLAVMGAVSVVAVALLGREGERRLARGPDALLEVVWPLPLVAGGGLAIAVLSPSFGVVVAACATALACLPLMRLGVNAVLVTVAPPDARVIATAMMGVAVIGAGGLGGLLLLSGLREAIGPDGAIAALLVPAVGAGAALRSAAGHASADLARMLHEEEDAQRMAARAATTRPHLLAAHGLVVAYDHRRVLDAVDVELADGEALAVLGTNGAGKSTLLRALSGLAPPAEGRVRFGGRDITHLDADRRARLGLGFVPSGGGTFGPLTVREGLRVAARAAPPGTSAHRAVDEALERFPALGARAGVRAVALSEGERRLLALAQALLLQPVLLLVDEPTRGLAPPAAEAVLAALREVNRAGTAVVLVEQSIDAAAAVAARACFLERGRVRFAGSTDDLRARDDLLRPVFLRAAGG